MRIELMCPECLSTEWTCSDGNMFTCDGCGKMMSVENMIASSDYYVYRFVNDDWNVPFYVGKGSNGRYKEIKGRNKHVISICGNYKWHSEIIRYCQSETEAYDYEKQIKHDYKSLWYPIIDGEKAISTENQRKGIERAKAEGKYLGGHPKTVPQEFFELFSKYRRREISKTIMAKQLGISRPTLDKWIRQETNHTYAE